MNNDNLHITQGSLLSSLKTVLITASKRNLDSSWANFGQSLHRDPYARIYYLFSGSAQVIHSGQEFTLTPGNLYLIPAHTLSRYRCPKKMQLFYIHFNATVLQDLDIFTTVGCKFQTPVEDKTHTEKTINQMLCLMQKNSIDAKISVDAILRQLIAPLLASTPANQNTAMLNAIKRFQPVLDYIEQNLHKRMYLNELASLVNLQPTYFSNLFCKHMSTPPLQYITNRRIEKAEILIQQTDLPLKEIAQTLGFYDEFHFSKTFKKTTGLAPSDYKNQPPLER